MSIKDNSAVSFHYSLTDDEGQQLDSSAGKEPLAYLHGAGNIIPGLENALTGKAVGDSMTVAVSAAEGYGEVQQELIQDVPRTSFQGVEQIEVGMQFEAQTGQGGTVPVTVTAVTDETVTVDGNHPLAGKNLNFDVSIEAVRDATAEELEHGHVHGPGGHEH
ncbi:peptidylprolyl isomerase [Porticoccaceae bacterium]|nr:peptidylprolyl isomerase [Porticoccaceae bacterium]MDA8903171.1 peptidylprolyl isomerase [Porticoccaceae bacterium]MDA8936628.1 peptidylprolyl isomerase [Porticoccaceae bacterium]MDB2480798.1 peptidylprolyl isomerase [Porticoccaceae bacterium]